MERHCFSPTRFVKVTVELFKSSDSYSCESLSDSDQPAERRRHWRDGKTKSSRRFVLWSPCAAASKTVNKKHFLFMVLQSYCRGESPHPSCTTPDRCTAARQKVLCRFRSTSLALKMLRLFPLLHFFFFVSFFPCNFSCSSFISFILLFPSFYLPSVLIFSSFFFLIPSNCPSISYLSSFLPSSSPLRLSFHLPNFLLPVFPLCFCQISFLTSLFLPLISSFNFPPLSLFNLFTSFSPFLILSYFAFCSSLTDTKVKGTFFSKPFFSIIFGGKDLLSLIEVTSWMQHFDFTQRIS